MSVSSEMKLASDTRPENKKDLVAIPRAGSARNIKTNDVKLAYYNFDKLFSYNAMWMFLIGARGLGKTYGTKLKLINGYMKKGEQFIYVRRYKEELKTSQRAFFADIEHNWPDWDFRVQGSTAEMAPADTRDDKKRPWEVMGFFVPLSTAQSQKGVSFHNVTSILFDEFIIEKGSIHYLPDEATAFTNFYLTVDRNKDKTKVFFLANSVSIMNPYFLEYDIKPDQVGEFLVKADGYVVCHFADSAEFSKGVYQTKFGKFIQGTEFAKYAVGSEFADNNDNLIGSKQSTAKYHYSIETKQGIFSVWIDWGDIAKFYIQERRPKQELLMTIIPEKMSGGKTLLSYSDKMVQLLRTAFRNGNLWFDNPKSRNAFIEIFKR